MLMAANEEIRAGRSEDGRPPENHRHRLAVLPYLAARPLIEGLDASAEVELIRSSSADMPRWLASDTAELAMLSPVDLQRFARPLVILPAGCIASDGPTMLVRLFSRVPPEDIQAVWTDPASHSTMGLAEVLWSMKYHRHLRTVPLATHLSDLPADAEAILLTGDCVVADPPLGFDYQIDLGAMWQRLTGLPFVFAVWAATELAHAELLNELLLDARELGRKRLGEIAQRYGPAYGWPVDLARRELTQHLSYELTDEHLEGLQEFFDLAKTAGVIDSARPIQVVTP
ncbi:MAG TPA: hypothetical protein ENH80_00640 [Phycisphaerae bacterium]|nr:hypothetical protein [Phycisphaerae bacterium]HDZ42426.1 hypothetical protein [Phycisphaerae bacterium]